MKKNYFLLLVFLAMNIWAQPANDDCANATVIDNNNFSMFEDASSATNNNGGIDVCGSPAWGMNDGVWFKLTGAGGDVTVSVTPSGWNCQVDVYSGSCGSFTCIMGLNNGVTDEQETGTFFADNGVDYFINVGHWAYDPNDPQADSPEGPFNISVVGAVLNNDENTIANFTYHFNSNNRQLSLLSQEKMEQIVIYDLLGQEVVNIRPNQTQSILNLSALQTGLYIVKVKTLTQNGTYKIIVK